MGSLIIIEFGIPDTQASESAPIDVFCALRAGSVVRMRGFDG
jgi:hypothetical protein